MIGSLWAFSSLTLEYSGIMCLSVSYTGQGEERVLFPRGCSPQLGAWNRAVALRPSPPQGHLEAPPPSDSPSAASSPAGSGCPADTQKPRRATVCRGAVGLGARLQAPGPSSSCPSCGIQFPEQEALPTEAPHPSFHPVHAHRPLGGSANLRVFSESCKFCSL